MEEKKTNIDVDALAEDFWDHANHLANNGHFNLLHCNGTKHFDSWSIVFDAVGNWNWSIFEHIFPAIVSSIFIFIESNFVKW